MPAPLFTSNPADYQQLEGLYITEQNPPGFIRGVTLGTVGIMGECVRGPVDTAVEITSEARFKEVFGGRDKTADGTGGTLIGKVWRALLNKPFGKLVIVRAAASGGSPATASFDEEDTDGGGGTPIVRISASSQGTWGNNVKYMVENATSHATSPNKFNLTIRYLGADTLYEDLDCTAGNNNLLTVLGDDYANHVVLTKLADGRPLNTASYTGAYAAALDADGFMNLGTTVASFTSVPGADGTIAATDYTAATRAFDQIKEYKGVSIVMCADDDGTITPLVNTAMATQAALASDRVFLAWTGDHTDTPAQVAAYAATLATANDRMILCANSPYTLDPETATEILVTPHEWMASILSQTDVDIHPGEEATKEFTAGITALYNESWARADYITVRDAGVCALEKDNGYLFVSGVTMDLTSGKTEITRRRSADFLQLSAADRLKYYVKKKNLAETRRIMGGEIIDFSDQLKRQQRVIEEYEVDQESLNTEAQRAQGLEYILWRVKLIGHMLHIVLKTEIGTGVTIEV